MFSGFINFFPQLISYFNFKFNINSDSNKYFNFEDLFINFLIILKLWKLINQNIVPNNRM